MLLTFFMGLSLEFYSRFTPPSVCLFVYAPKLASSSSTATSTHPSPPVLGLVSYVGNGAAVEPEPSHLPLQPSLENWPCAFYMC